MKQKKTVHRVVETKYHVTYTIEEIREALHLPSNAVIFVDVPGGGDWSNTELLLDDAPLQARFSEREEKTT